MTRKKYIAQTKNLKPSDQEKEQMRSNISYRIQKPSLIMRFSVYAKYVSAFAVLIVAVILSFPHRSDPTVIQTNNFAMVKNVQQPLIAQASSWGKIVSTKWNWTITRLWQSIQPDDMQVWDSIILPAKATLTFTVGAWAKWTISGPAKIVLVENANQKKVIDIRFAQNFSIISLIDKSLNIKTPTWVLALSKNSKKLDLQLVVTPTRHIVRNKWDSITIAGKWTNTIVKSQMIATVSDKLISLKQIKSIEAELIAWKTTTVYDINKDSDKGDLQRAEVLTFFDKQNELSNTWSLVALSTTSQTSDLQETALMVLSAKSTDASISSNVASTTTASVAQEQIPESKKVLDRSVYVAIEWYVESWCDFLKLWLIKTWLGMEWENISPSQIIKALDAYYVSDELISQLKNLTCSPKI
jgi:hypothetical protein